MQSQQPPRLNEGTTLEQLKALREEAIEFQEQLQNQLGQLAKRRVMLDEQIARMEARELLLPKGDRLWTPE